MRVGGTAVENYVPGLGTVEVSAKCVMWGRREVVCNAKTRELLRWVGVEAWGNDVATLEHNGEFALSLGAVRSKRGERKPLRLRMSGKTKEYGDKQI